LLYEIKEDLNMMIKLFVTIFLVFCLGAALGYFLAKAENKKP